MILDEVVTADFEAGNPDARRVNRGVEHEIFDVVTIETAVVPAATKQQQ
ncbi:PIN domain containing protein [Halapricum desulfuricans]|uniref:PIN domain containing protein n=1 Tax=Halapricum desulfuricans TaxID=2841257 RepID=A0A897N1C6_9EURY|nr:PIN domain containing protein [Halapricum desulfuricans]